MVNHFFEDCDSRLSVRIVMEPRDRFCDGLDEAPDIASCAACIVVE